MQLRTNQIPIEFYRVPAWRIRLAAAVTLGAFACLMGALAIGVGIVLGAILRLTGPA